MLLNFAASLLGKISTGKEVERLQIPGQGVMITGEGATNCGQNF